VLGFVLSGVWICDRGSPTEACGTGFSREEARALLHLHRLKYPFPAKAGPTV
jgi:hypothetical protein